MTNLVWRKDILCNIVADTEIIPNRLDIKAELIANTSQVEEQEVALERLKLMSDVMFGGAIFVNTENEAIRPLLETLTTNVVFLPDDPYDHLISMLIHLKISAILEGRFLVHRFSMTSQVGGGLEYVFDPEVFDFPEIVTDELLPGVEPWWRRPDMSTMDLITEDDKGNKILHEQDITWEHVGLSWEGVDALVEKEGKIIDVKKFKPKVIDGSDNI